MACSEESPLLALPREIRDIIWRELFSRKVPIRAWFHRDKHRLGRCSFDANRQKVDELEYDKYSGKKSVKTLKLAQTWKTRPTHEQIEECRTKGGYRRTVINEDTGLPEDQVFGVKGEFDINLVPNEEHRTRFIRHTVRMYVEPFHAIKALRTCKQICREGSEILYSTNSFVFDTRARGNKLDMPRTVLGKFCFRDARETLPGGPRKNGKVDSPYRTKRLIARMFNRKIAHAQFLTCDPMIRFMRTIGRENTRLLRNIKLEGYFKTNNDWCGSYVGFGHLLDVYVCVLRHVCPDLRKLILNVESTTTGRFDKIQRWDDLDYLMAPNKSDDKRIDDIVKKVVQGLPQIRVLRLGDCKTRAEFDWGMSERWISIVQQRSPTQPQELSSTINRAPRCRSVMKKRKKMQQDETRFNGYKPRSLKGLDLMQCRSDMAKDRKKESHRGKRRRRRAKPVKAGPHPEPIKPTKSTAMLEISGQ